MALNRPDVFRAAVPEAWREGGDAIYWVPQRTARANRSKSLLVWRRDGNASKHGLKFDSVVLEVLGRLGEHGEPIFAVELPFAIRNVTVIQPVR
jgi:hypothetical protein